MSNIVTICCVDYADAIAPIQAIRRQVFQQEQGVAEELEFDGADATATHLLAYQGDRAVGTTRIRYLPGSSVALPSSLVPQQPQTVAKIERVAVLSDYRGYGIGQQLMEEAIAHITDQHVAVIKINAQLSVQAFYERLGFQPQGNVFEEAGIFHITMWHVLPALSAEGR